jgi:hypothetical protein
VTTAGVGFSPLDQQLELWEKNWSGGLVKEAVWLSGVVGSFEEAERVLRRIGHVSMSDSTVWRRVERWGEQFRRLDQERQQQAQALPNRGQVTAGQAQQKGRMGLAMDGAMVHVLGEGWKEFKVGCVYEIEPQAVFDKESQEWLEMGHAVHTSYVAHLGGPELFGRLLWTEAQQRGWEAVYDTQVVGDGARWIWNLTQEHFYDSYQTVDWYHAADHLHAAAQLYRPDSESAAQRWYKSAETSLFQGHADQIAHTLQQKAVGNSQRAKDLRTEAQFFENNKRRMQYLEFREDGYLIGSGPVESGAKQFKARFTGPGMRWSRAGIERLIPVRAAIMSSQFDDLWPSLYCNSPPN